jgi:hypothetical protein
MQSIRKLPETHIFYNTDNILNFCNSSESKLYIISISLAAIMESKP